MPLLIDLHEELPSSLRRACNATTSFGFRACLCGTGAIALAWASKRFRVSSGKRRATAYRYGGVVAAGREHGEHRQRRFGQQSRWQHACWSDWRSWEPQVGPRICDWRIVFQPEQLRESSAGRELRDG